MKLRQARAWESLNVKEWQPEAKLLQKFCWLRENAPALVGGARRALLGHLRCIRGTPALKIRRTDRKPSRSSSWAVIMGALTWSGSLDGMNRTKYLGKKGGVSGVRFKIGEAALHTVHIFLAVDQ